LYLLLDDAMRGLTCTVQVRVTWLRESAELWNRKHIETLVRFSELSLYASDWRKAIQSLRRADEEALVNGVSTFYREEMRGKLLEGSPYGSSVRVFSGTIVRLVKPTEGFIAFEGVQLFFRVGPGTERRLQVGDDVSFSLAWRIRGLRAIQVRLVD